jgi:hypothetical protein
MGYEIFRDFYLHADSTPARLQKEWKGVKIILKNRAFAKSHATSV